MVSHPSFDTIMPLRALQLIDEYGTTATFEVPGVTAYDPETGKSNRSPIITYTKKVTPPEERPSDGTWWCYLAAKDLEFTPVRGMIVIIDGHRITVMDVRVVRSGESKALWELRLDL